MSEVEQRVYLSATPDGNLDMSIPEGGTERPLEPVELLLLGVFIRASNDEEWAKEMFNWVVDNYEEYFKQGDSEAAE